MLSPRVADGELEFDHRIVQTGLGKLQEDLSSLPHDLPPLLLYPRTQQAVTAMNVVDTSGMRQRGHRLNRRKVAHGQYPLLRELNCDGGLSGEEIADLEVQGVRVKHP